MTTISFGTVCQEALAAIDTNIASLRFTMKNMNKTIEMRWNLAFSS